VLLICDAWFDIMTAGPGQVWVSVFRAEPNPGRIPLTAEGDSGAVRGKAHTDEKGKLTDEKGKNTMA
jgi:hypothetical protein